MAQDEYLVNFFVQNNINNVVYEEESNHKDDREMVMCDP